MMTSADVKVMRQAIILSDRLPGMTDDELEQPRRRKTNLGKTGHTVARNVARLRGERTYESLSKSLTALGRPIAALGLRRIESGDRRVDADDLVALSMALGVSPISLLNPDTDNDDDIVEVTAAKPTDAHHLWEWMRADTPLYVDQNLEPEDVDIVAYYRVALPTWRRREIGSALQRFNEERKSERSRPSSDGNN